MKLVELILGFLTNPVHSPFGVMFFFGFFSHFEFKWFLAWFLSAPMVRIMEGSGVFLVTWANARRLLKSYLGDSRYRLRHVPIMDPQFLKRFDLPEATPLGNNAADRNFESIVFFEVEGLDRETRLNIVSQCFVGGGDFPTVVFLRRPLSSPSPGLWFEFLHELGHSTHSAEMAESIAVIEPLFILVSAFAAWSILPEKRWVAVMLLLFIVFRLRYWHKNRAQGLEAELCADAFAVKCQRDFATAKESVRPFVEMWVRQLKSLKPGSRRWRDAFVRSAFMTRKNLRLHAEGRRSEIRDAPVNYSIFSMVANGALILSTLFATRSLNLFLVVGASLCLLSVIAFVIAFRLQQSVIERVKQRVKELINQEKNYDKGTVSAEGVQMVE